MTSKSIRQLNAAFTLIELLIVVAIIAILAAIAVPNFLEAQTRSKVSRAKADMRTIATGLEAYYVDYNKYPLDYLDRQDLGVTNTYVNTQGMQQLTTPVAYMTSVPTDLFTDKGTASFNARPYYEYRNFIINNRADEEECASLGYSWYLASWGPSRERKFPDNPALIVQVAKLISARPVGGNPHPLSIYDPTNGTISWGYIIRTNKGEYGGEDYAP